MKNKVHLLVEKLNLSRGRSLMLIPLTFNRNKWISLSGIKFHSFSTPCRRLFQHSGIIIIILGLYAYFMNRKKTTWLLLIRLNHLSTVAITKRSFILHIGLKISSFSIQFKLVSASNQNKQVIIYLVAV